jgi:hypothetical protein
MAEPEVSVIDNDIIANMAGTLRRDGSIRKNYQLLSEYRAELLQEVKVRLELQAEV